MANSDTPPFVLSLDRALRALILATNSDIQAKVLHTFLVVAAHEGKTVSEMGDIVGSRKSSISRHLLDLGSGKRRNGEPGFGLVQHIQNPNDLREVICILSPRGKQLLKSVEHSMEK